MSSLATRLYRGEAGVNVVGKRPLWFGVAGAAALIALLSVIFIGFQLGVEFRGGNQFELSQRVGTLEQVEQVVRDAGAEVTTAQRIGGGDPQYSIRTTDMSPEQAAEVKAALARAFNLELEEISDNRVGRAWGEQVTERALLALVIFIAVVTVYLALRFEWRMALAAIASLLLDLVITAGIYALVGFEVTPSTVIGFLTILGFALYDVVVVFDKIQENTRGITGSSTQTYGEASNLAVNQVLMRSINTSLVALLPVGGLLFIGAGLLGAGTLKDLGLVLFVGMAIAVYSSLFFATPVLVTLKEMEPRIRTHTQRVLARRAGGREAAPAGARAARTARPAAKAAAAPTVTTETAPAAPPAPAEATSAPRAGARPSGKRPGGRPGGGRPSGAKRR